MPRRVDYHARFLEGRPVRAIYLNELDNEVPVAIVDRYSRTHVYIRYSNQVQDIVPLKRLTVVRDRRRRGQVGRSK